MDFSFVVHLQNKNKSVGTAESYRYSLSLLSTIFLFCRSTWWSLLRLFFCWFVTQKAESCRCSFLSTLFPFCLSTWSSPFIDCSFVSLYFLNIDKYNVDTRESCRCTLSFLSTLFLVLDIYLVFSLYTACCWFVFSKHTQIQRWHTGKLLLFSFFTLFPFAYLLGLLLLSPRLFFCEFGPSYALHGHKQEGLGMTEGTLK